MKTSTTLRKWVEMFVSRNGRFYFHVKHRNGKITNPSQLYASRQGARRRAKQEFPNLQIVNV